jgi:hypothetical protein
VRDDAQPARIEVEQLEHLAPVVLGMHDSRSASRYSFWK